MNAMIAVGIAPIAADAGGGGVAAMIAGLSVFGLILLLGALRSARRAPVYVVRDIGRPF
jgi:hypothetical protein